jgi:hypothetical protein
MPGDIFNVVLALEDMANIMVKKIGRLTGQLNNAQESGRLLSEEKAKVRAPHWQPMFASFSILVSGKSSLNRQH